MEKEALTRRMDNSYSSSSEAAASYHQSHQTQSKTQRTLSVLLYVIVISVSTLSFIRLIHLETQVLNLRHQCHDHESRFRALEDRLRLFDDPTSVLDANPQLQLVSNCVSQKLSF